MRGVVLKWGRRGKSKKLKTWDPENGRSIPKKSRENPMMAKGVPRMNKSRKDAIEMISR